MPISGKRLVARWRKKDQDLMVENSIITMFVTYLTFVFAAAIPAAYVLILHHYFKHLD